MFKNNEEGKFDLNMLNNLGGLNQNQDKGEIVEEIHEVRFETIDPDEMVEEYIQLISECESNDDIGKLMYSFFEEVFTYAIKEQVIADIQGKIQALKMIDSGEIFDEDEDE